jgi:spore germination cell wall hydrolase CwlJ-like protein
MKLRKLIISVLIIVITLSFTNTVTYAAEGSTKSNTNTEDKKYTKSELRLLSSIIYCEAGGESYNGKLAVGIVVMNRVRSYKYPDTVKEVIYQKYQFSPVRNGTLKKALAEYDNGKFTSSREKECIKAAKEALSGAKSVTINGKKKSFSKYLSFSGRLRGYTYKLGNHQFK